MGKGALQSQRQQNQKAKSTGQKRNDVEQGLLFLLL